ncbi:MAG: RsmE family RNA methyltransferase, partial [Verrucomicrobiota bacterium]
PQTARDLLRDATTLGVAALHFVLTEKSDPNYAASTLWTTGEWRRHLLAGAAQAFDTHLPQVTWGLPLADALALLPSAIALPAAKRITLDNYEAISPLAALLPTDSTEAGSASEWPAESPGPAGDRSEPGLTPIPNQSPMRVVPLLLLAFGPERGWGVKDRALLRAQDFTHAHLGSRPLRLETAVVAALAIAKAKCR